MNQNQLTVLYAFYLPKRTKNNLFLNQIIATVLYFCHHSEHLSKFTLASFPWANTLFFFLILKNTLHFSIYVSTNVIIPFFIGFVVVSACCDRDNVNWNVFQKDVKSENGISRVSTFVK